MPSCEKCWEDARLIARESGAEHVDEYGRLVQERDCTPEERAGRNALRCPTCQTKTVHQHAKVCLICGWSPSP